MEEEGFRITVSALNKLPYKQILRIPKEFCVFVMYFAKWELKRASQKGAEQGSILLIGKKTLDFQPDIFRKDQKFFLQSLQKKRKQRNNLKEFFL